MVKVQIIESRSINYRIEDINIINKADYIYFMLIVWDLSFYFACKRVGETYLFTFYVALNTFKRKKKQNKKLYYS